MDSLLDYDQDLLVPPWGSLGRDAVLGCVAAVTKLLLNVLNKTRALNHNTYLDLVMHRPPGVGLLTISNHTSTYDDPGLPCALLPLSFFWTEHTHHRNRWTMCAKDICFTNEFFRQFFLNGKVLPVERGAGVDQASVSVAARALGSGDWLHIFPEGRVVPSGRVGPFRQGIGKLICEARGVQGRDPIILPFFHSGMSRVMPFKSSLPRVGQTVVVAVGQPLDLSHITCRCNQPGEDQPQVWRDLAVALRHAVMELEDQVPPNRDQVQQRPEVAEYERRYQERMRKAREQQLAGGGLEPTLMQAAQQQRGGGARFSGQGQGGQQQGGGQQRDGQQQQQQQQDEVLSEEQEWLQQQQQLLAVVRRVSRQQQVELEHIVEAGMTAPQEQQQQQGQQERRPWQQWLAQGRLLLQTHHSKWQELQDRQVALLLARSRAAVAGSSSSSSSSSGASSASDAKAGAEPAHTAGSSSWSWAWLPFVSQAAASDTGAPQHHKAS